MTTKLIHNREVLRLSRLFENMEPNNFKQSINQNKQVKRK